MDWTTGVLAEPHLRQQPLLSWVCLKVYREVRQYAANGRTIHQVTINDPVSVYIPPISKPAAFGFVVGLTSGPPRSQDDKFEISIVKVLIPGLRLNQNVSLGNNNANIWESKHQLRTWNGRCQEPGSSENTEDPVWQLSGQEGLQDDDPSDDSDSDPSDVENTAALGNPAAPALIRRIAERPEDRVPQSKVLKDAFHLMDMIRVSKKHPLYQDFSKALRDVLFVVDEEDRSRIEEFLLGVNSSWNRKVEEDPSWIFRRVRRVIPPAADILSLMDDLFRTHGPIVDPKTGKPLFDDEAWRKARLVKDAIAAGHVSDPINIPLYFEIGLDKDGLPLYRCSRGTSSIEGGVHQNIIRKFGGFGASPFLLDCMLADYRLRHNIDVGYINKLPVLDFSKCILRSRLSGWDQE